MSLYRHSDYRDAIAERIEEGKVSSAKLSYSGLAEAITVQKPYITRVIKKDAHFNSDQLYLTCQYLHLNEEETQYMMLLMEWSRSVVPARRKELHKNISEIQMHHRDTRRHLKAEFVEPLTLEDYNQYYLDPIAPLVHTFLSIPAFAKSHKLICAKLHISEKRLKLTIKSLESLGIVKWNAQAHMYQILRDHMQLVADSPLNLPYQIFQRTNAIQKIQTQMLEDRFVFSVAFSCDEKGRAEIHEEFLKFIKKTESVVKSANPADIYQMNFDLFGWN